MYVDDINDINSMKKSLNIFSLNVWQTNILSMKKLAREVFRSAGENPWHSAVLTDSFHMSEALSSTNIEKDLSENRSRSLRGERQALSPLHHRSPK